MSTDNRPSARHPGDGIKASYDRLRTIATDRENLRIESLEHVLKRRSL